MFQGQDRFVEAHLVLDDLLVAYISVHNYHTTLWLEFVGNVLRHSGALKELGVSFVGTLSTPERITFTPRKRRIIESTSEVQGGKAVVLILEKKLGTTKATWTAEKGMTLKWKEL